mgnify:CR=1 FL=1
MNNKSNNTNEHNDLHLSDDQEIAQTETLLDLLAQQDRSAADDGLEGRVLESVSKVIAPPPLSIASPDEPAATPAAPSASLSKAWPLRYAAAAMLAMGATVTLVATQPWSMNSPANDGHEIALASFEQDLDAFFALEELEDGNLSEAVTEWEIWAQTLDTEIDTSLSGIGLTDFQWIDDGEDGAL